MIQILKNLKKQYIKSKTNNRFSKLWLVCYFTALFVSVPYAAIKPFVDKYQLLNSDYVAKAIIPIHSEFDWYGTTIFAYDDNKDVTIDRIVALGACVPATRPGPGASIPYKKTYASKHPKFKIYLDLLISREKNQDKTL